MKRVVGIDEAGRGPLVGPVAVGGVQINSPLVARVFPRVRDSKQLTPKDRAVWFEKIRALRKSGALSYNVVLVSHTVIDMHGISHALSQGVSRVLHGLVAHPHTKILLDGALSAPKVYRQQKTIVRGDEKELAIALASIVAKVTRDARMVNAGKQYPKYGLEKHKGYGTKAHIAAIRRHGLSPVHRKTFCRKFI